MVSDRRTQISVSNVPQERSSFESVSRQCLTAVFLPSSSVPVLENDKNLPMRLRVVSTPCAAILSATLTPIPGTVRRSSLIAEVENSSIAPAALSCGARRQTKRLNQSQWAPMQRPLPAVSHPRRLRTLRLEAAMLSRFLAVDGCTTHSQPACLLRRMDRMLLPSRWGSDEAADTRVVCSVGSGVGNSDWLCGKKHTGPAEQGQESSRPRQP